jgi:hypothetical protein
MICDCCDRNSRWAHTSPDDVGWCSMCQTYQWRRDAPVRFYPEGGKPEKGHACVRCDEPWGMGLEFVWHRECRCGAKGPWPAHEAVEVIPGKIARMKCQCGWTAIGRYEYDEDAEDAMREAKWVFEDHQQRQEERRCQCSCHGHPDCLEIHADRQDRLPRRFTCEHSTPAKTERAAGSGQ